jgi:hypothetical protein
MRFGVHDVAPNGQALIGRTFIGPLREVDTFDHAVLPGGQTLDLELVVVEIRACGQRLDCLDGSPAALLVLKGALPKGVVDGVVLVGEEPWPAEDEEGEA